MTKAEQRVIAIVNDEAAVRESLRFLLEVAGYTVETFASAADLLEAETQELTCVVLDHHMPHMTGLELAEQLRADGVAIPIFLIVGSPSPTILLQAAELGIDRVLEKPADYENLHNFANATRSRGRPAHPINAGNSAPLSRGLPIFLKSGSVSDDALVESETDFIGWHGDRWHIEIFLCRQFPEAQPNRSNETEVPSGKKSAPPNVVSQPTITLKQMAVELAESHKLPKKQTEAVLADLMAGAASDDDSKPEPAIGSQAPPLIGCDVATVSSSMITPVIDAEGRSGLSEKDAAARNAAVHKLIAERAYELWENQGRPHGCDLIHWLEAEQAIKGCLEYGSIRHGGEPAKD